MPFTPTTFPGLIVIEPNVYTDHRGFFFEAYNAKHFAEHGIEVEFVQDNQSHSSYGVVRGLHYQAPPYAQSKLVRVLQGTIIDTVVDLRVGSPTYGETFSIELSSANKKQLFVPKGFAHGFSVISETAEVLYKCDEYYHQPSERGIIYNDPELAIDWKLAPADVIVSGKDLQLPLFSMYEGEFSFSQ